MTAAQLENARLVAEELRLLFTVLGGLLHVEESLEIVCKANALPLVNGDLLAKLGAAHMAAAEAMDAYDLVVASAAPARVAA